MTIEEAERRLKLFGIPPEGEGADDVRKVLAHILSGGALTLSDLQIARDVVAGLESPNAGLYLFLAAMRLSLKEGNAYLTLDKGAALLKKAGYQEGVANSEHNSRVDQYWSLYARAAGDVLAQGDKQLVVCHDVGAGVKGWSFARVWDAVKAISESLTTMAAAPDLPALTDEAVARAVQFPFALNPEQKMAVKTVGKRRFTVVTGGPGTGKTTVVCAILRALLERGDVRGEDIALIAPTGRAGQRMGESIQSQCEAAIGLSDEIRVQIEELSGTTIHSVLGGMPPKWKYTKSNRLPYRLVIVDESSMVDVHLMRALLEALSDECRLVLLGDKDQLPSVDAGAVLGDVVAGFDNRTVVQLVTSNRFTGALADCAQAINEGDKPRFNQSVLSLPVAGEVWTQTLSKTGDCTNRVFRYEFPESAQPTICNRLVREWARNFGLLHTPPDQVNGMSRVEGRLIGLAKAVQLTNEVFANGTKTKEVKDLFEQLDRSRILTVVRKGVFGAEGINDLIVMERFHGRKPSDPLSKVGVPVMITRNTRERNLWNGDIGVTVMGPNGMVVLFPRGEKVAVCPVALLPEHELAYAMTVHKSQGSEFENVMVVLPNDVEHPLLNRQVVYTGITRAKKRAVILGTNQSMENALQRILQRDTGIGCG